MAQESSINSDIQRIIKKILEYLPSFNVDKFKKAFEFAKAAHEGQFRKDQSPYITHPLKTANILATLHADEDSILAAILHDVPEDTQKTIEDVANSFGQNVAFLVDGITKLSKVYYRHDMAERQLESLKKLLIHSAKDPRVILIKLADRLHNMRTLDYVREDKRKRIAIETMEIYVPIANLFGIKELKNELEDLCFYYLYPEKYVMVSESIQKSDIKLKSLLQKTIQLLIKEFAKEKITADIYGRHRSLYSIFKKLQITNHEISEIKDIIALRIIATKKSNCYKILGIVHNLFKPKVGSFKDYIAVPKSNGYQSLHTTVFGLNGISTEFQIRTKNMHVEAEYGILSRYFSSRKSKILQLDKDKRSKWVDQILDIQKIERDNMNFMEDLKQDIFEDRIFVFTPEGDSIDLPKFATCIDFAYAIHTDVGNKAIESEVNGEYHSLTHTLKTGDTVKIITSKDQRGPKLFWLNFARTNLAKNKIRDFLSKDTKNRKVRRGKNILQKDFDRAGLGIVSDMNFRKIQNIMKKSYKRFFSSKEDLFSSIGSGDIKTSKVINILLPQSDGLKKNYFFSKSKSSATNRPARVDIQLICDDRIGLLRDLTAIISEFTFNIIKAKTYKSFLLKKHFIKFYFEIKSFNELNDLLSHLEQVEGVKSIIRLFWRRQITFIFFTLFTFALWLAHPLLMIRFIDPTKVSHKFMFSVLLFGGFVMLFSVILLLKKLIKKSFPQFREMQAFWVITSILPLFALFITGLELFYLKLYANSWPVVVILMVTVCFYLAGEYYRYRTGNRY